MSLLSVPLSSPIPGLIKKKRVLLVDGSSAKRELRAEAMRRLGMDVDCACDISEARAWWRADLYNLVLINREDELGHTDKFCQDIRESANPQQLAFLVGKPEYLSGAPGLDELPSEAGVPLLRDEGSSRPANFGANLSQRWGIMEASKRISAVRSVWAARSMAMRNRPTPPRDMEVRQTRKAEAESQLLAAFSKEELQ